MEPSIKEKQEKYYEEALHVINFGSVYYQEEIKKTRKQIAELGIKTSDAVKGLSASQIEDEKSFLKGQIDHLYKKQNEFVQKQSAIKSSYIDYKKGVEKRGANYFGDINLINNLSLARGIENKDRAKDRITVAFNKEFGKLEKEVSTAFDKFDKTLTKNSVYIVNNNGSQVFRKNDFSDITFKNMVVDKNNQIEQNYPKEQNLEQLEEEKNEILNSIEGHNQIQEVMDPKNEFNISDSMKKDLSKCEEMYGEISKHKQIVSKIEEVLNRFEVDERDQNIEGEIKKDRSKDYAKLCKALHKLKQKEINKILKLENKVKKPMEKNNVQKLCGLVEERKEVEGKRVSLDNLEMEISSKENELTNLMYLKNELSQDPHNVGKVAELNEVKKDIARLESELKRDKENLKVQKDEFNKAQKSKLEHSKELTKYTTKDVLVKKENNVQKEENKPSFSDTLKEYTNSDQEYLVSSKDTENRNLEKQKQKNEQNMERE